MTRVSILILSDTLDFATDYITTRLEELKITYARINRDRLSTYDIRFDIDQGDLLIRIGPTTFQVSSSQLKSVYYRAPIFLRESFSPARDIEAQLETSQWMAFVRNLTFFDGARWMNNPVDIFRAENKFLQLKLAKEAGMRIPRTIVTNNSNADFLDRFVVKSIDTVMLKEGESEVFFYTNIATREELSDYELHRAPVFFQEYLEEKIDLRVTVVGDRLFACEVLAKDATLIKNDWRLEKDKVYFRPVVLPQEVSISVLSLAKVLNLNFAGIDLIRLAGVFYFVEVNPTGEWAWLVDSARLQIDEEIVQWLIR